MGPSALVLLSAAAFLVWSSASAFATLVWSSDAALATLVWSSASSSLVKVLCRTNDLASDSEKKEIMNLILFPAINKEIINGIIMIGRGSLTAEMNG